MVFLPLRPLMFRALRPLMFRALRPVMFRALNMRARWLLLNRQNDAFAAP
jgi:hypothetical protein